MHPKINCEKRFHVRVHDKTYTLENDNKKRFRFSLARTLSKKKTLSITEDFSFDLISSNLNASVDSLANRD